MVQALCAVCLMTNNFQRIPGTVQKCKGRQLACELKEGLTLCYDRPQASLTGVMSCKYLGSKKSCVCVYVCLRWYDCVFMHASKCKCESHTGEGKSEKELGLCCGFDG